MGLSRVRTEAVSMNRKMIRFPPNLVTMYPPNGMTAVYPYAKALRITPCRSLDQSKTPVYQAKKRITK